MLAQKDIELRIIKGLHNHDSSTKSITIQTKLTTVCFYHKPDHMVELLEAIRKMTKYFKRSYKHSKPHLSDNSNCHISTNHYISSHSDKHNADLRTIMTKLMRLLIQHVHLIAHPQNPKIVKNIVTQTVLIAYSIHLWAQNDYHGKTKLLKLN